MDAPTDVQTSVFLKPCPWCGGRDLKLQTPVCDDGMVRDIFFRCFCCGSCGPALGVEPISLRDVGEIHTAPIYELWNVRAS